VRTSAVVCGEISEREEFADMAVGVKAALNILFLDGDLVVCNGYESSSILEWCFWDVGVYVMSKSDFEMVVMLEV
jgi:hypothetical protein